MIEQLGVDRVISIDLHSSQIQGFFSSKVPVDNLSGYILMVNHILESNIIKKYEDLVIVSPDAGGVYRYI
jgi:ribose-phosphate pyrophosphokinase